MRRATATATFLAVAALVAGCGAEDQDPAVTAPTTTTGAVASAPVTTVTATHTPTTVPKLVPPPKPDAGPTTRAGYLKRLDALAAKLGGAIDAAAASGDSTPIATIDEAVQRTTKRWLATGGAPSPAAQTLAAAIATARTNVESSLLAPESRRQVQAARDALTGERGAG